ncbi:lactonase family protein [Streptomyces sp. ODS28]|uniref:lactonase family protein n=1 Tax=Streptomyces sp. ODS28 TaxID=3136688 RepID=UPI0031E82098
MSDESGQHAYGALTNGAFIGSFTSAGGRGVTAAHADPATGALTPRHHTETAVPDPSYLAMGDGLLYAVSETESGAAAAFSLSGTGEEGRPELLGAPVPVHGDAPTHLALAGGRLFIANYTSGNVTSLPVRADGSLGTQAATHQHEGSGPDKERQEGPHAHAVVPDPSGRWLLCADLGTDSAWIYELGGDQQELRLHREVALTPGSGPRHLVFHPDGTRAYLTNELDSTITALRWDAADGVLEPAGSVPALPEGEPGEANFPSGIVVSGDGRFLWVANRGHDSISTFALPESGKGEGLPRLTDSVPCGGHWPRALALHPTGRWLYAANERSGDVTWFALDADTGAPRRAGSVTAPAASCVVFTG